MKTHCYTLSVAVTDIAKGEDAYQLFVFDCLVSNFKIPTADILSELASDEAKKRFPNEEYIDYEEIAVKFV